MRHKATIIFDTEAFVPTADIRNVPDGAAGQLLAAAMSGYDRDEQGRIVEFKIERVEARH